ncbi:unnamed protein product [Caenorhabditis auriculariae]|uniref:VWFA domain-containing protein n=1 Tax=Caenorhabditis auriculariae TaxID=2777116 RepID=A0A8S1H173_9PELO|nr:unnamed protein product [Caenorhabditis auriculariae]
MVVREGFLSKLTRRDYVVLGIFVFSLAMLIAGSVMLGVGISKANSQPNCPSCPAVGTCPTATVAPTSASSAFLYFTSSYAASIAWDPALQDPNSNQFKSLADSLQKNISQALSTQSFPNKGLIDVVETPLTVSVNAFSQANQAVNFYSTIVFPDANVQSNELQNALNQQGFASNVYTNPTNQCNSLAPPQAAPTTSAPQNPSSVPTDIPISSSKRPLPSGVYCDASQANLRNVYLVDVAVPTFGFLDVKLSQLQNFLTLAAVSANLSPTASWGNVEFRLVAYGGTEAQPLGRANDMLSWKNIISQLNSSFVNPNGNDVHALAEGLRYVASNYVTQVGTASNIIIVTDGYDFSENPNPYAAALKSQYYTIGAIVATQSQLISNAIQQVTSDYSHTYVIDSFSYLQNSAILQTQAMWICNAFYPTPAPKTPAPTRIPLKTTSSASTTRPAPRTTLSPGTPTVSECSLNVLFLIDESQVMLSDGYSQSLTYATQLSQTLSVWNSASTFAFITFNDVITYTSANYQNVTQFALDLQNAPQTSGGTNIPLAFNASRTFISAHSQYSNSNTRSVLIFVSHGVDKMSAVNQSIPIVHDLRSNYQTQVVAVDIQQNDDLMKKIIEYNVNDGYVPSTFIGLSSTNDLTQMSLVNNTIFLLQCKGGNQCGIDLTFVIEVSEIETSNYVAVQKKTAMNIINAYRSMISPFGMSVSFIYFSTPLNSSIPANSGVFFQQLTDPDQAVNALTNQLFPVGGATDLDTAFILTASSLSQATFQKSKYVLFFARGNYDHFANCCPDPTVDAALVRSMSTVQGVVIGPNSNKQQLDFFTGSNSLDANSLISNLDVSTQSTAAAAVISAAIQPLFDSFINSQICNSIPDYVAPCQNPIDVIIFLHAKTSDSWTKISNFTGSELLPGLLGSPLSRRSLTTASPINLAIVVYGNLGGNILTDFSLLRSPQDYSSLLATTPFSPVVGTPTLSWAYKKANELFLNGRTYASRNMIVISDDLHAHDNLVMQFGGFTTALQIDTLSVPGADYTQNVSISQIDSRNPFARRNVANALASNTCTYAPLQTPGTTMKSTTPTLPGPIPLVKARSVWPDITILIDTTSYNESSPYLMNGERFEKIRQFLDVFLSQYSVGEKFSRFTIATFDGTVTSVSCTFSQTSNYYDLSTCRNEKLSFYSRTHSSTRDINQALKYLQQNIFVPNSGYRSLNENFLIIFTMGVSSTPFTDTLVQLQRQGVRTVAVGLSSNLTNAQISGFGQKNYLVPQWDGTSNGIDSSNTSVALADRLVSITTKRRSPSTSNFFANVFVLVDQTLSTQSDQPNVVQFVKSFVKQFQVASQKTQISVVPYEMDVINPLGLTSSQTQVDQWLSNWTPTVSQSNTADFRKLADYLGPVLAANTDRPSYLVYVIGSTSVQNVNSPQFLLNSNVMGFVAQYNPNVNYSSLLASPNSVFSVYNSNELLDQVNSFTDASKNPIVSLYNSIFSAQEAKNSANFPLVAVSADIVLLVDETGINATQFEIVKSYLSDFTSKFSVGFSSTQFALQAYNGRTIAHEGFHFSQSTDGDTVRRFISQLRLEQATEGTTDADLAGAIVEEKTYFLTKSDGWRDDATTFTVIFSHAESFYNDTTDSRENAAKGIKNVSEVFAIGYNGKTYDYVKQFLTGAVPSYGTVDSPENLKIDSPASVQLLSTIKNDYRQQVYPPAPPLSSLTDADFIFLLDAAIGTQGMTNVKNFLNNFIYQVGDFTYGNSSRLSLITYDDSGVRRPYWNLNDQLNLAKKISNITLYPSSLSNSNLRSALEFFLADESQFGVKSTRQTYVTLFAGAPTISPFIDIALTKKLNTRYSTFTIQTNQNTQEFSYIPQFLGSTQDDRFAYSLSIAFTDNSLNSYKSWLQSEYSAWKTTFLQ